MNEQIFKLALKAMDFQGAIDIDTELKMTNSELAKFTELIVKECIDILDDEDDGELTGRSVRIAAIRIKKHFEVEE
jgi:hypothetical protein